MPMVEVHNLTKYFGAKKAVDDVTFSLEEGDLCGFIGPNGAGKTTTIKILATLLPPNSGSVFIATQRLWPGGNRARIAHAIGYMPDQFGVYENMKVWEYLEFFGLAYNLPQAKRRETADAMLALTDLDRARDEFVLSLSRGQQQRLSLARTLMHDPSVLLLDEPASGLDPQARIEMRALLSELRGMGKTILLSSHILTELATVCNKLCVIQSGRLLFSGTPMELQAKVLPGRVYQVAVSEEMKKAEYLMKTAKHVVGLDTENHYLRVHVDSNTPGDGYLSGILQKAGLHITLYRPEEASLEEAYMKLLKD